MATFIKLQGENTLNNAPDINRFMRGVFNIRPPQPKYTFSWDVNKVLQHLKLYHPLDKITLKEISLKAIALVALTSGLRAQSIHDLDTNLMSVTNDYYEFRFTKPAKHERKQTQKSVLRLYKYHDPDLDIYNVLTWYLKRTAELRRSSKLWISFTKPHEPVGKQTISRWLKTILQKAGIDVNNFTSHSTRMASTSKASAMGVGLTSILNTAGWTNAKNFYRFYLRPIEPTDDGKAFAEGVLAENH